MIDSHCHLDFCDEPSTAADSNLRALISVGTNLERNVRTLELAERLANTWAAVGVHPNNASDVTDRLVRDGVERQASHQKVVAIGETGFDTYWQKESLASQRDSFLWHAELASELDKPLILHVRDGQNDEQASLEAARMLEEVAYPKGILHCFNGHERLLETGLGLGWMVSFAGNLTYKSAVSIQAAAQTVPEDRLLVETDSPYLAPIPKRGRPNRPVFVHYTAAYLAELRGVSVASIEALTDQNAIRVFRLPLT
jgi:TatD DNase family protein